MLVEEIECEEAQERLPGWMRHAFAFQVFNSISYMVLLSTPTVLWFQSWKASATELGILAALTPLMNFLQLPAASRIERSGYRRFVLKGWVLQIVAYLGIIAAAFLPLSAPLTARMTIMWISLAAYNAFRGYHLCGCLPWMTVLTPEKLRGRFLSGDQMSTAVACVVTLLGTAIFLGKVSAWWNFGVVFVVGIMTAVVSFLFLRRLPDAPVPVESRSTELVPWLEILKFAPFRKLVAFNVVMNSAFAASSVFWAVLIRDQYNGSDSIMLGIGVFYNVALVLTLLGFARLVDRVGSRPLLGTALWAYTIHFLMWGALAARVLPFNWTTVATIQLIAGFAASLFNLANTRLLMQIVPRMGRSHFFALITVIVGSLLGTLPVLWGLGLDRMKGWHTNWGMWEWNRFTVMYVILAGIMVVGQFFRRRVPEPKAMSTDAFWQELLVNSTSRALALFRIRRPLG